MVAFSHFSFKWGSEDSKGVKIGFVGLYFSMCMNMPRALTKSTWHVLSKSLRLFLKYLIMDGLFNCLVRDHVQK